MASSCSRWAQEGLVAAKARAVFVCQQCGNRELKWAGRCSECGEWGSLVETLEQPAPRNGPRPAAAGPSRAQRLSDIAAESVERVPVPLAEIQRVLGGGLVPGSVNLIGGDPGIGKSTLLLQLAAVMAPRLGSVLYVSGEESARQIKLRAERLGIRNSELLLLAETELDQVLAAIEQERQGMAVI